MAFATAAAAQNVAPPANPDAPAAIGEIIVTAQRRGESVQRAALSIQALAGETLARANVTKAEDLTSLAPGVQVGSGGPFPQTYIRGVGNYAVQAFAEGAVAYNLDGVYISRPWATRGMFYDLDRVEVLKGPQGTLYGRNASGGAINLITVKPSLDKFGGFAQIDGGDYDLIQGAGAVNVPLSSTVAIRASGQVTRRNGYLSDGYDDDKTQAGRLQLLAKPSDDVSLVVSGSYQHSGGMGSGGVLHPQIQGDKWRSAADPAIIAIMRAQPGLGPLLALPKSDGFNDSTIYAISAELNWNLGFATLTVLPAYRDGKFRNLQYTPGFSLRSRQFDKQTSAEVRLANNSDKLKWVVGSYYFNESQGALPGQNSLEVNQGITAQYQHLLDLNTRSYAAFGQATYSLTDRFRVTGGLRYTHERKRDIEGSNIYNLPNPNFTCSLGTFDPTSPVPPAFCRFPLSVQGRVSFNNVSYKAGVEYDLAPQSLGYANVSTGYKSGGFFTAPPPNTFKPEKLFAVDGGVKNRFLDNRLQVNIEGFYWRYKDHQESFVGPTSIPGFFGFLTFNAGRATSYGADLDILYRATRRDTLSLKVQYNKTKYNTFAYNSLAQLGTPTTGCAVGPPGPNGFPVDCSGKPLVRAPRWTGTAGYVHSFDLGDQGSLDASFNAQFASASYLAQDFLQSERQKAYVLGDFDLTYTTSNQNWAISVFVHNIGNQAVANQAFHYPFASAANPLLNNPDGANFVTLRAPRTFGGRLRYNF